MFELFVKFVDDLFGYVWKLPPEVFVKNLLETRVLNSILCQICVFSVFYQLAYFVFGYEVLVCLLKLFHLDLTSPHLFTDFLLSDKHRSRPKDVSRAGSRICQSH